MKEFLGKYKAQKIETSEDEGKLTLETAKKRILNLLVENIQHFKNDTWSIANRMNKLMIDTDSNTIFSLRLGGKKIVRYSLDLLDTMQKMQFLADFHTSVSNNEFDEDIVSFLAKEVDIANQRKKEANERRRLKKQEERERKALMAKHLLEEKQQIAQSQPSNTKDWIGDWILQPSSTTE